MRVLQDLQPERVFYYFEEISRIPHGSRNTKEISDYCVTFAKEHGLRWIQDEWNNVIIFKDGTGGSEEHPPVIIQGHLDMVCEKEPWSEIDFEKDGLKLQMEGDDICAEGTTLGGDDGIAVAYALALLEDETLCHPPLEVVLTVDEEIGMLGAAAIDCTPLKGKRLLNIDSEEEGYLLVSCAGGVTVQTAFPIEQIVLDSFGYVYGRLELGGLTGGHSGVEIDKNRGNANQLIGRVLYALSAELPFYIKTLAGGQKDNAIPREAHAVICLQEQEWEKAVRIVQKYQKILKEEYRMTDSELCLELHPEHGIRKNEMQHSWVMSEKCTKTVIGALVNFPGGIQKMSLEIPGLVQTSLNMGILRTTEEEVRMSFSVRSSIGTEKEELVNRLQCLTELLGGRMICEGDYPAWEYRQESDLRELMVKVYEEQTGTQPVIQALHAGLECGFFSGKISGLDCVSFGPDILDIHTPAERMSVSSVKRTWEYMKEILARM